MHDPVLTQIIAVTGNHADSPQIVFVGEFSAGGELAALREIG